MEILFYVFLGIVFDVAILIILKIMQGERQRMQYGEYLQKYSSIADSNPGSYSNYNDYICEQIAYH
jgi:hypothetical protein